MPPKDTTENGASGVQQDQATTLPEGAISAADAQALLAKNEELQKQLDEANGHKSDLQGQVDALTKEKAELTDQLGTASDELETVTGERDSIQASFDKLNSDPVVMAIDQRELRKVGPLPSSDDEDEADTLDLSGEGEHLVVFSDGKKEIRGVKPISVSGPIWEKKPTGWVLNRSVPVDGPAPGASPYEIRGVGLFDDEDNQIRWTEFPEPIRVPAGGKMELRHSVIFK